MVGENVFHARPNPTASAPLSLYGAGGSREEEKQSPHILWESTVRKEGKEGAGIGGGSGSRGGSTKNKGIFELFTAEFRNFFS